MPEPEQVSAGRDAPRRYDCDVKAPLVQRSAAVVAAAATPCVVIAVAVFLFLNPIWVAFDQDRSGVDQLTGYTTAQVRDVTGSILSDVVFGPPRFEATLPGAATPVLDASERGHMADVRTVLMGLGTVALVAAILLLLVGLCARGRRWFWRAVAVGARLLIAGVVVVGLGFALFFDQAFELFHEIFFAPGTYMFDPRTEKLVQLFPDQFWSETSVALAGSILVLAILVAVAATRLGREPEQGAVNGRPAATPPPPVAPADAQSTPAGEAQ
jgi:integral membrane protein (TIGR01906 family)